VAAGWLGLEVTFVLAQDWTSRLSGSPLVLDGRSGMAHSMRVWGSDLAYPAITATRPAASGVVLSAAGRRGDSERVGH